MDHPEVGLGLSGEPAGCKVNYGLLENSLMLNKMSVRGLLRDKPWQSRRIGLTRPDHRKAAVHVI
jgi:hypothetical protein